MNFQKLILVSILISVLILPSFLIFAQNEQNLEEICEWEKIEQKPENLSKEEYEALLKKCQEYYQQKSQEIEKDISKTEQEKKTLQNKIYWLKNTIKNLDYQIYQSNLVIKDIGFQIQDTKESIGKTSLKIENSQEQIANILRTIYEKDQKSLIEILLSEKEISGFYNNLFALETLHSKSQELLDETKNLKTVLGNQKQSLNEEKQDLESSVIIKNLQKQENAKTKKDQEYYLNLTEKQYQEQLQEKEEAQEQAIKIGNLLFELIEVPEGGIRFEDAVEIAKSTSILTGIRASFSLAILWQETRIGKLKGGCYLRDTKTGDGIYIKTGNKAPRTMKPSRDIPPFLNIIKDLNATGKLKTDYSHTPVSCCMILNNGELFGWGGAMGAAQFIPSTWMLVKKEIEEKTGDIPANPWNIRDAFLANGLYLRDLGASAQTYEKEMRAALRYFGCTSYWCEINYGKPVMAVAKCLQQYIDNASMSSYCEDLIF